MPWADLLNPYPGGNRRLALQGFHASLKKLEALTEAAIHDEEALDHYWPEIVEETARLKSQLITPEEKEWARRKQQDTRIHQLTQAVRERDGDTCRYCGDTVTWTDRKSSKRACYSHINIGQGVKTPDDMVIACRLCDQQRSRDYAEGKPLRAPSPLPE